MLGKIENRRLEPCNRFSEEEESGVSPNPRVLVVSMSIVTDFR